MIYYFVQRIQHDHIIFDNCELLKVNTCNIYFTSNPSINSEKYIIIEDNGAVNDLWGW